MLLSNKKARLNYEILEELEAGIELLGYEVKALRGGKGQLDGAHIIVRGAEAFLTNMNLPPYQPNNTPKGYEPERPRKLLLTKDQIAHLAGYEKQKGLTILPLKVYNKGLKLKVVIGISRGKKKADKREDIKRRDTERDIGRKLKRR
jgi:SsrA-binding protein